MNFIFPIAGKGSRFLELADRIPEYGKPKPLIDVKGMPMIKRAVNSFPLTKEDTLIFVVRKEHIIEFNIDEKLRGIFGKNIEIIIQENPPEGAAKTVLLAKDLINNSEEILITDSDFILDGEKYIKKIRELNPDFAVPVFYSENPRSSFAKVDENDRIVETAEKNLISKNAMIGSYYFREGKFFVEAVETMITENLRVNNEFYISPAFNYLIKEGKKGFVVRNCKLIEMGTPELLEKSLPLIPIEISENIIETMKNAAKKAGDLVMDNYSKTEEQIKDLKGLCYTEFDKIKKSLVSNVDFQAGEIILKELKAYSNFSVCCEEDNEEIRNITKDFNKNSEFKFVIDPLDGTSNYLAGNDKIRKFLQDKYFEEYKEEMPDNKDKFGVCISLTEKDVPVCSVIYYPKFKTFLVSTKKKGVFVGDKKIQVKKVECHNFADPIRISQYSDINRYKDLFLNRKSYHASCFNLKALLEGDILSYCTDSIDYLDFCPFLIAYIEAGGFIGDEKGNKIEIEKLVKEKDENNRIKRFMILCPGKEYCLSLLKNLKEKGFSV